MNSCHEEGVESKLPIPRRISSFDSSSIPVANTLPDMSSSENVRCYSTELRAFSHTELFRPGFNGGTDFDGVVIFGTYGFPAASAGA
eukprot:gene9179-biopygen15037